MVQSNVVVRDPWSVVPSLGDLDKYISAVNRVPLLTDVEELEFARKFRAEEDLEAARKLVVSHLRLVVSISRRYLGYGLPLGDLIQEGNVGLMKAVKRFNPEQGNRLVSYAIHWIKSEIHEYILKNWRIVKMATTKAQRKLFFNLRSLKQELKSVAEETHHDTMTQGEVAKIAAQLNVDERDVIEMEKRLTGADVALEPSDDGDESSYTPIMYLADDSDEPTRRIENNQHERLLSEGVSTALNKLDPRSRRIIEARWMNVDDDGSGGLTLQALAAEHGISAERVRQIEIAALKKLRKVLESSK